MRAWGEAHGVCPDAAQGGQFHLATRTDCSESQLPGGALIPEPQCRAWQLSGAPLVSPLVRAQVFFALALVGLPSACHAARDSDGQPDLPRPQPLPALDPTGALPPELNVQLQWRRALATDPMDLSTLARAKGTAELLRALEAGGRAGFVALQALPFVTDEPAVASGVLCALIGRALPQDREPFLRALRALIETAPREAPQASGVGRCEHALRALAASNQGSVSDLASSVLQQLRVLGPAGSGSP